MLNKEERTRALKTNLSGWPGKFLPHLRLKKKTRLLS